MFEVHRLDGLRCAKADEEGKNGQGMEEGGVGKDIDMEMTPSPSEGFSESSDVTLVEDGPTTEPALLGLEIEKASKKGVRECIMDADVDVDADMSIIQEDEALFEKYLMEDVDLGDAEIAHMATNKHFHPVPATISKDINTHTQVSPTRTQPWEVTWYARWELLVELVRRDQARGRGVIPGTIPGRDRPGKRMFYLGGDDDGEDGNGNMDVDEDEDDYGVLVANPAYPPSRVFDTGG